jgi:hypothetical protein
MQTIDIIKEVIKRITINPFVVVEEDEKEVNNEKDSIIEITIMKKEKEMEEVIHEEK